MLPTYGQVEDYERTETTELTERIVIRRNAGGRSRLARSRRRRRARARRQWTLELGRVLGRLRAQEGGTEL